MFIRTLKSCFVLVLAVFVFSAQEKAVGHAVPTPDPVSSFKLVVGKFTAFFASGPRKAIMRTEWNPRDTFVIEETSARDIAYDVEKTNSLVSPYSATIQMRLYSRIYG